jgi:hypothetical protein
MKRRLQDRIHDRAWREIGQWLACPAKTSARATTSTGESSSVSAAMPWAEVCAAFADGNLTSSGFRRNAAVRDIVETVGAVEGCFYANQIVKWGAEWLNNPAVAKIDAWGNPIRWPGCLLGTPKAFSPTTLRYLATALWLKRSGYLAAGSEIVEIGVGFGGLAAMNALVSKALTTLVDLPQVEHSALRMLGETDLASHGRLSRDRRDSNAHLVISNYAFTELNSKIQNQYFEKYLKHAAHAVIISNSAIFAASIRGRSDDDLIGWFRSAGHPAKLETQNELLGPGDHLCGVSIIHW